MLLNSFHQQNRSSYYRNKCSYQIRRQSVKNGVLYSANLKSCLKTIGAKCLGPGSDPYHHDGHLNVNAPYGNKHFYLVAYRLKRVGNSYVGGFSRNFAVVN